MNSTEQTAQPSAMMLDRLNVLQTAGKKAQRKAAKADLSSFGEILSEKSLTLQKKNGQSPAISPNQKAPSAKEKTAQGQQATGSSTKLGEKIAVQKGSSQAKGSLTDLPEDGGKAAATPIAKEGTDPKEKGATASPKKKDTTTAQTDEAQKQSTEAAPCDVDPMQGSDRGKQGTDPTAVIQAAVIDPVDSACENKTLIENPEQILGGNAPTAQEGSGMNASTAPGSEATGGMDRKNLTMADPSVKPSAGDAIVPRINPEAERFAAGVTANTPVEETPLKATNHDNLEGVAAKAPVEETLAQAANRENLDRTVAPRESASVKTPVGTSSPGPKDSEIVGLAAGEPNTAEQATAERSIREESNLSDKRLEAPKADAPKRSAVNVETDNSQDRVAVQMERETATKASWTDREAALLSKPNRHTDHTAHDRTVSGLSSKEAAQLAADETKKSTTSLRDNGAMNRPASSGEAEVSSVRTAATTRLNPSKETVALYASTAAESETDRSKVMAAKGDHDNQASETAQMKSFTLGSSQSAETGRDSVAGPTEAKARALVNQIVEARQQMSSESGRIKITLTPPNLGTVDLDVVVRQNRVEVIMIADHADVQQLLQARGEEIKSALQRQDMKIDSFQVFLQSSPDGGQQQQSGSWTAMQDHSRRQYALYDTQEDEGALPLPTSEVASTHLHKGLVSIFA